jgi:hypothetical protein
MAISEGESKIIHPAQILGGVLVIWGVMGVIWSGGKALHDAPQAIDSNPAVNGWYENQKARAVYFRHKGDSFAVGAPVDSWSFQFCDGSPPLANLRFARFRAAADGYDTIPATYEAGPGATNQKGLLVMRGLRPLPGVPSYDQSAACR